ncbi:hypothetical protein CHS0354_024741 [Potamilus streckersoni]|uniref:Uncharacterized protein n=1 Tax=Potamilus streckersoni TaxID=2493646 RepID=A0AAE0VK35_9BIVA|nr:hypothetical protein CHS0354_024741 [Potamilus streckersoni]
MRRLLDKSSFLCISRKSVISDDDRMIELRNECKQLTDKVRKHNELAGELIVEKKRRWDDVTAKCMEFKRMIESTRKELNKILDEKEEESLKDIKEIEFEEKTFYNDFVKNMTDVQVKLASKITELEKVQNESYVQLTSDLVRGKSCLKEISDIIRKCSTNVQEYDLQYKENQEVIEVLKCFQPFGKISKIHAINQCQLESALNSASGQNYLSSADKDVEYSSDIYRNEVPNISEETLRETDIVALPNGRLVISAATTDSIKVIEKDGTFAFCSTDFKNPQGIVHMDGNRIALATANGVFILVVQSTQLFQLQKLCEEEIFGIYYRNQILAMCANNCVLIASAHGKVINRIERFGLVIKYQLQNPRHVAIDMTGKVVYISDEDARKVVCSTIKGIRKWEHQLPNGVPKGIEFCENIYVAVPENKSIADLSPSGEFLASYCIELNPYGLHVTAEENCM